MREQSTDVRLVALERAVRMQRRLWVERSLPAS
jgi:hypothetical protein